MKLLFCLFSFLLCHAQEVESVDSTPREPKSMYYYMAQACAQNFPLPPSEPISFRTQAYAELKPTVEVHSDESTNTPSSELQQTPIPAKSKQDDYAELMAHSLKLKQENITLENRLANMEELLADNNRMLKALLETTQQTGANLEGIEKGHEQIESDIMSLTGKMRQWKNEVMSSQEHPFNKILRYARLGFNVSASAGTALSTYYTLAWVASILPAAATPPGWILISTSATTGALYYVLYSF